MNWVIVQSENKCTHLIYPEHSRISSDRLKTTLSSQNQFLLPNNINVISDEGTAGKVIIAIQTVGKTIEMVTNNFC